MNVSLGGCIEILISSRLITSIQWLLLTSFVVRQTEEYRQHGIIYPCQATSEADFNRSRSALTSGFSQSFIRGQKRGASYRTMQKCLLGLRRILPATSKSTRPPWICSTCRSSPVAVGPRLHQSQLPRRSYATEVSAAELTFGQPLHETHPHLLGPGERTSKLSWGYLQLTGPSNARHLCH